MNKKLYPLSLCARPHGDPGPRADRSTSDDDHHHHSDDRGSGPGSGPRRHPPPPRRPGLDAVDGGPLTVNLKPESFDIPDFGKIYVSGA